MGQNSLLLIGSGSQIGREAHRFFHSQGIPCLGTDRTSLDLEKVSPDWRPPKDVTAAIFFAAITNIHECERDPTRSRRVNVEGTETVLKKLAEAKIRTIFLSTNLVFSGDSPHPDENQPTRPQTLYGHQKAEVEAWMAKNLSDYAILRIAKVLVGTKTLIHDWKLALQAGQEITPFADLTFCPITVDPIHSALRTLVQTQEIGPFHLSGEKELTYEQAAQTLCQKMGLPLTLVRGTPARQLGYQGPLPRYSALGMNRLANLGVPRPSSQENLEAYIEKILR